MSASAILLVHCPDQKGIVAALSDFLHKHKGNILDFEQYVHDQVFFARIEWSLKGFSLSREKINKELEQAVSKKFKMEWQLYYSDYRPKMAVFVSKQLHCLQDIIYRCNSGEWDVDLKLIISNHPDVINKGQFSNGLKTNLEILPITKENKLTQEKYQLNLMRYKKIDFIVLARYMQVLSDDFINQWKNQVINIHHSFLPAFPGARPYKSAHERGVKIIGATSHYATAALDAGPIIEQDIVRVSHKDSVGDLIRKGRDLEKVVLSRAIWNHLNRKIHVYGNRTIVFN